MDEIVAVTTLRDVILAFTKLGRVYRLRVDYKDEITIELIATIRMGLPP